MFSMRFRKWLPNRFVMMSNDLVATNPRLTIISSIGRKICAGLVSSSHLQWIFFFKMDLGISSRSRRAAVRAPN